MVRLAVDVHGASTTITGVTALFYAEHIEIAQEAAQALSGGRLGPVRAAIDAIPGQASSARICSDRYRVTWRLYAADPCTSSKYASGGNRATSASLSSSREGYVGKRNCTGRGVAAVTVNRKSVPSAAAVAIISAAD